MAQGKIRIGISGWRYAPWRGVFYPKGLRQANELAFAAKTFPTIEINGTFYSLQRPDAFRAWYEATPQDFVFALKGPRYITHILRLDRAGVPLANFFASGVLRLKQKLGPILWQLPPSFPFRPDRLEAFFAQLPRSTRDAARLAQRHDNKLKSRAWLKADMDRPLRHALEIRHDSFRDKVFVQLLRRHGIGLVVADTVAWPCLLDVTADFVYCRLHGAEQLYVSGYDECALSRWAKRVQAWVSGCEAHVAHLASPAVKAPRDVYVYFDNDARVRAPFDAQALIRKVNK